MSPLLAALYQTQPSGKFLKPFLIDNLKHKTVYVYSIGILGISIRNSSYTVSALFEPRGSIFQNGFLSGVLLIFDLPGVVIETGVY